MTKLFEMTSEERERLLGEQKKKYEEFCSRGLHLDMSRGNPSPELLSLSGDLLTSVTDPEDCISEDGVDCRNYGTPFGIREARELFSEIILAPADNILIGGSSSLNLMFDVISRAMTHGLANSPRPWGKEEKVKFLCPVPGYDRHYKILEYFGIEMISVPLTGNGPDMDFVESVVSDDGSVKGIWCIPVYSNYSGEVYSGETIKRLAEMETKAPDFVVLYDDSYTVHDLYKKPVIIPSFFDACIEAGNAERPVVFSSTSKMTFAGGGLSCVAFGGKNLELAKNALSIQLITHDKINQLRHVRVLKDLKTVRERMDRFGEILRPKFETVEDIFEELLGEYGIAEWSKPLGGYFICFRLKKASAKRVVYMCNDAGVKLTPAGAGFPYGIDESDSYIRIAPTYPSVSELKDAATLLCVCSIIDTIEQNNVMEDDQDK
jgi:DNA-binding transcriptional MocR family regulator